MQYDYLLCMCVCLYGVLSFLGVRKSKHLRRKKSFKAFGAKRFQSYIVRGLSICIEQKKNNHPILIIFFYLFKQEKSCAYNLLLIGSFISIVYYSQY
jgi:hypothetical protein